MSPRIFILAGTHREAQEYARENHWTPAQWRYIDSPHCLHGLRDIEVYRIGNWRSREDLAEIYDVIEKINCASRPALRRIGQSHERCRDCRFWFEWFGTREGIPMGQCHRYPPAPIPPWSYGTCGKYVNAIDRADWPVTNSDNFCGEFKRFITAAREGGRGEGKGNE